MEHALSKDVIEGLRKQIASLHAGLRACTYLCFIVHAEGMKSRPWRASTLLLRSDDAEGDRPADPATQS